MTEKERNIKMPRIGWWNGQGTWATDKDVLAVKSWIENNCPDAIIGVDTAMMPFRPRDQRGRRRNFATVRRLTRESVVLVLAIKPTTPTPRPSALRFGHEGGDMRVHIPRQGLLEELRILDGLLDRAWKNISHPQKSN